MTCTRCHGLLIWADALDRTTAWTGWKCVACGDWTDPVILAHRGMYPLPEPDRGHALPVYRPPGTTRTPRRLPAMPLDEETGRSYRR